jgi:hypothetical protein
MASCPAFTVPPLSLIIRRPVCIHRTVNLVGDPLVKIFLRWTCFPVRIPLFLRQAL